MRCAASFLIVVVISIIVCAVAVLIISLTDKIEGSCNESISFRCPDNGTCLPLKYMCDNFPHCNDSSDEAPLKCQDWTTLEDRFMSLLYRHDNPLNSTINVTIKPNLCLFHEIIEGNITGVHCDGRKMTGQLTSIPWDELDPEAKIMVFKNGALNASHLPSSEDSYEFPNLGKLYITNNSNLQSIGEHAFCPLATSAHLHWLIITDNPLLETFHPDWLCRETLLIELKLEGNGLTLTGFQFKNLPKLNGLNLNHNKIESITESLFSELPTLKFLQLNQNKISFIHERAFANNKVLIDIDLRDNKLHQIPELMLQFNSFLKKLTLTENPLRRIPKLLFQNLSRLVSLDIESFDESQFDSTTFSQHAPSLEWVRFKKFSYCKYAPQAGHCSPSSDGVSSDAFLLFGHTRVAVWFMGLATVVGNSAVLIIRVLYRRRSSIRDEIAMICDVFLNNLAIADLLMGVYLLVLAIKDMEYAGIYRTKIAEWGSSLQCTSIGILALLSSEVSLFIITLMSIERYLTVRLTNLKNNIGTWKQAAATMLIIWLISGVIAVAPAVNWQVLYYGSSSLCFPIHLDDRYAIGWKYTAFVIVGVNSICLLVIAYSYTMLFRDIMKSQWKTQQQGRNRRQNANMAVRMFLIVFTDVLCWAPIILLKVAVLLGFELSEELVSFAVIYLLPLNSAANPILYTFSTETVRNGIKAWIKDAFQKLGLTRIVSPSQSNSIELQGRLLRRIFDKNESNPRGKDQFQSNTAATDEDTELTHSACPTVNLN